MEKTTVNGDDAHPVFKLGKESFDGDIAWNFAGIFLFDGEGKCEGRYDAKGLKELGAALAGAVPA
jgi:glutathione peroxidase-family protein